MQSQFDTRALFSLWKLVKCNGKRTILWSEERTHTQTRTQTPNVISTELEIPSGILAKMQLFLEEEATVLIFDLFYTAEQFMTFLSFTHPSSFFFVVLFLLFPFFYPWGGLKQKFYSRKAIKRCSKIQFLSHKKITDYDFHPHHRLFYLYFDITTNIPSYPCRCTE